MGMRCGEPLKLVAKCCVDVHLIFSGEEMHYLSLDSERQMKWSRDSVVMGGGGCCHWVPAGELVSGSSWTRSTTSCLVSSFHPHQNLTDHSFMPSAHLLQGQSQLSRLCLCQNWKSRFSFSQHDPSKNGPAAGLPLEGRSRDGVCDE